MVRLNMQNQFVLVVLLSIIIRLGTDSKLKRLKEDINKLKHMLEEVDKIAGEKPVRCLLFIQSK